MCGGQQSLPPLVSRRRLLWLSRAYPRNCLLYTAIDLDTFSSLQPEENDIREVALSDFLQHHVTNMKYRAPLELTKP